MAFSHVTISAAVAAALFAKVPLDTWHADGAGDQRGGLRVDDVLAAVHDQASVAPAALMSKGADAEASTRGASVVGQHRDAPCARTVDEQRGAGEQAVSGRAAGREATFGGEPPVGQAIGLLRESKQVS